MMARLKNLSPRVKLFAGLVVVWVFFDQLTKYLCVAYLTKAFMPLHGEPPDFSSRLWIWLSHRHPARGAVVEVVEHFWHMRYVENPGAAWGFLGGAASWFRTPFFLLVSLAAMIFIIAYFRKTQPEQGMLRVALACVFGGALGNFLDRARLGYVIDFIDWHWYDRFTWPTWNIADAGISIGVGLLILDMILHKPPEPEPQTAKGRGAKKGEGKGKGTGKGTGKGKEPGEPEVSG